MEHRQFAKALRKNMTDAEQLHGGICVRIGLAIRSSGAVRDAWLRNQGFTVLRFWNNDILQNIEEVLEAILKELAKGGPLSPSPSPTRGEGSGGDVTTRDFHES